MSKRYISIAAVLACLTAAATPAFATDDPPPSTPPAPPAAAPAPTPASPTSCLDLIRPHTKLVSTSRSAAKKHLMRGTAADQGCSTSYVARVQVSISHRHGNKCEFVTSAARLSRQSSCSKQHWLTAHGTATWSVRIPKRLARGSYQVFTRAVDSAGNVERAHARRLAIR